MCMQSTGVRHMARINKYELKVKVLVAQSCQTLSNLMDCSPLGSSVHGILQAKILECVAISSSRGPSQPYIKETSLLCIRGYPRLTWHRKLSLESLNSIPILYLWLADSLFLYLGFKANDMASGKSWTLIKVFWCWIHTVCILWSCPYGKMDHLIDHLHL